MMKTNHLPKADMLDIVFEHRNKDYGAYVLRREYPRRLTQGMALTFFFATVCCFLLLAGRDKAGTRNRWTGEPSVVELTDIVLPSPPSVKPPEPPSSPSRPMVRDQVPVVVPNHMPLEHPVPAIDELAQADPGITSQSGHPGAPNPGSHPFRGSDGRR